MRKSKHPEYKSERELKKRPHNPHRTWQYEPQEALLSFFLGSAVWWQCMCVFLWLRRILSDHLAACGCWFNLCSVGRGGPWLVISWRASSNGDTKGQVGTQMVWQPTKTSVSPHEHGPSAQSSLCTCGGPPRLRAWNINDQYCTLHSHKQ